MPRSSRYRTKLCYCDGTSPVQLREDVEQVTRFGLTFGPIDTFGFFD
jgi:hypothetical protein